MRFSGSWRALLAVAAITAAAATTAPLTAGAQQARQRSITVTVLDEDGRAVTELQPDDIIVREDGLAREIVRVEPAPPPTELVLLVDDSQAVGSALRDVRDALQSFTELVTALEPAPAVRLVTFGDRPTTLVNFTSSFSALSTAIERIAPRPGAGATLLEAIDESARALIARESERPVMVAFVVEAGPEFGNLRHTQVRQRLQSANTSLWAIVLAQPGGPGSSDAERERQVVLGDVTRQSGGRTELTLAAQQLPQKFGALAAQISSRWQITYGRPDTLIPPEDLEVTGRTGSLRILAPDWATP